MPTLHNIRALVAEKNKNVAALPQAEEYIGYFTQWIVDGDPASIASIASSIVALPRLFIIHVVQYFQFLEDNAISHAEFTGRVRMSGGGFQGYCMLYHILHQSRNTAAMTFSAWRNYRRVAQQCWLVPRSPILVGNLSHFTQHYDRMAVHFANNAIDISPLRPEPNDTCGSTLNNDNVQNSVFATASFEDDAAQKDEPYNMLATSVYFILSRAYRNVNSTDEYETRFVCLTNSDFAEGSRKPGDAKSAARGKNVASIWALVLVCLATGLSLLVWMFMGGRVESNVIQSRLCPGKYLGTNNEYEYFFRQ